MNSTWTRLESALSQKAPAVLASLAPPASESEVADAEARLGFALPAPFRQTLLTHNGGAERPSLLGRYFFQPLAMQLDHRDELLEDMNAAKEDDDGSPWSEQFLPFGNQHSWKDLLFIDCGSGKVWGYMEGDWTEMADDFDAYLNEIAAKLESGALVPDEQGRLRAPR